MEEMIRLIENIHWHSVHKDNMEYDTTVSCYQKEAIEKAVALIKERFSKEY